MNALYQCYLCGRWMPTLEATARAHKPAPGVEDSTVALCHPMNTPTPYTCYHLFTLYGIRREDGWLPL